MHKRRTTLKWFNRQIKKRTREQSVMALTKKIARMTSVVAKKDLLVAEIAKESVMATSTERAQVQSTGKISSNDSSQGNNKKKRKKWSSAAEKRKKELQATATEAHNLRDAPKKTSKCREVSVSSKGHGKDNKERRAVAIKESAASSAAAATKAGSVQDASVTDGDQKDKVSLTRNKGKSE